MSHDKSLRLGLRALIAVAGCLVVYQCYVVSSHVVQRISVPFPVPYTEAVVFAQIDRLAADGTMYSDLLAAPFFPSLYPPVFHLFSTAFQVVSGAPILAPRLVSLTAFAIIISAGCGIITTIGKSITQCILGIGMFVCVLVTLQPIYGLAAVGMVDMLAAAFSFCAIMLFIVRKDRRTDTSTFVMICILAALAFWTKPTALYGPLAIFALLLITHVKTALRLALVGALSATIVGFVLWLYFGTNMLTNVFGYTQTKFAPDRAVFALAVFWVRYFSLAVFVVFVAILCAFGRELHQLTDFEKLALLYLSVASLGFFATAREGSDWNYIAEFCIALSISTGLVGVRVGTAIEDARLGEPVSMFRAGVGTGLVLLTLSAIPSGRPFNTSTNITPLEIRETIRLKNKLEVDGHRIFSADLGMKLLLGQEIKVEPATVLAMHRAGLWDIAPVIELIENNFYDCILDHNGALMAHAEMRTEIDRFPKSETFARYKLFCK